MQGLANSYAFWIFVFVVLALVYLLPTLIGIIRGVDRLALVFLVNLIGAPTGIGWFAAMFLAFGPRPLPPEPLWYPRADSMYGPTRTWTQDRGPVGRGPRPHRRDGDLWSGARR